MIANGSSRCAYQPFLVLIAAVLAGLTTAQAGAGRKSHPPGATLTELLAMARRTSPEVAAAALDAEAATAKIVSAGALPDPVGSVENDNFSRRSTAGQGTFFNFKVSQEFPLWGKRQLKADIAGFDATAAGYRRQSAELALETRIKSVFAARYATFAALGLNREIRAILATSLSTVRDRFAQNAATQEDVTKLEIEDADLETETARLQGQLIKTAAQLNALLSRPPDAPLAIPKGFRRLPPDRTITIRALVERAVLMNTDVAEGQAKASAAASNRELAERNRYPDLSLGLSATEENGHYGSNAVMAQVRIPLQWDAIEADVRAAAATQRAADARLQALKQKLGGDVAGMVAEYHALIKALAIMRGHHLPDAQLALKSALGTLETEKGSVADVLSAEQRVRRIRLDILKLETERQVAIAEIEKVIGSEL